MLVSVYNVEDTERTRARRWSISDPKITIGRSESCTVVIEDDDRVIEHHLEIELKAPPDYLVTPRGTTSVNGAVITGPTTASFTDTIQIGNTIVKLRAEQKVVKTLTRHERKTPVAPQPAMPEPGKAWGEDEVTPQQAYPVAPRDTMPTIPRPVRMPANPPMPTWNPPMPRYVEGPTILPPPAKVFRERLSDDDAEHALLVTLRAKPDDPGARMVYADWLEDHGFNVRAEITRGEDVMLGAVLDQSTPEWRAIAACTPIYDCTTVECPRQWSRFAAVPDDERLRTCGTCVRKIRYCLHTLDPQGAVSRNEGVIVDASVANDFDIDAGDTLDEPIRR